MPNFAKPIVLGTALLVGITIGTNADPLPRTGDKSAGPGAAVPSGAHRLPGNEVAALPPSDATPRRDSIVLPGVSVIAPFYSHPYTSGIGAKASPNGRVRVEHYQPPPSYVTDIAMHPYTRHIGPKAGPNRALRVEHYQVPPDYEAHVAMHPYTSGIGPSENGPRIRAGDLAPTARSHYNR
jgi:hypothetical protein